MKHKDVLILRGGILGMADEAIASVEFELDSDLTPMENEINMTEAFRKAGMEVGIELGTLYDKYLEATENKPLDDQLP